MFLTFVNIPDKVLGGGGVFPETWRSVLMIEKHSGKRFFIGKLVRGKFLKGLGQPDLMKERELIQKELKKYGLREKQTYLNNTDCTTRCPNGPKPNCPRFKHWNVINSLGDGWTVETVPVGSEQLPQHLEGRSCFVTSYAECFKQQCITLAECGLTSKIMDEVRPHIEVSEWYAKRFDCGIVYKLNVSLLDANQEIVQLFSKEITDDHGDNGWHQVSHTFKHYNPGVRYVLFEHKGQDTQFWAGHYGSKMAGGSVIARIPEEFLQPDDEYFEDMITTD